MTPTRCFSTIAIVSCICLGLFPVSSALTASNPASAGSVPAVNELGSIPILEYHLIEPEEGRWARSPEKFRSDLERLWRLDFRPIRMSDYVNGTIDLPAGKKPLLMTFDDSSPGQFRYLSRNGVRIIDPDCAVGMLIQFHASHPDFPLRAVFNVLPEAKQPHKLFGQPEFEGDKLRELDRLGFEIGNHTLWYARLDKYDDTVVQKQLALAQEAIRRFLPGYTMRALALPLGMYPRNHELAIQGSYHGFSYHNDAVLLVAGPPAPSPFSTACDLSRLPRIQVPGSELGYWLNYYEKNPVAVYRSDGRADEVSFPKELLPKFNRTRFGRLTINPR